MHDAVAADAGDQRRRLRRRRSPPASRILQRVQLGARRQASCPLARRARAPPRGAAGARRPSRMRPLTTRKIDATGLARPRGPDARAQPEDPDRDRGGDDQPRQPLGRRLDLPLRSVAKNARMICHPVAPEVDQQPDRAAHVQHHHEREPRGLGLGLPGDDVVPAEQGREEHRVPEARDREQLGRALERRRARSPGTW